MKKKLIFVGIFVALLSIVSAILLVRQFDTPNDYKDSDSNNVNYDNQNNNSNITQDNDDNKVNRDSNISNNNNNSSVNKPANNETPNVKPNTKYTLFLDFTVQNTQKGFSIHSFKDNTYLQTSFIKIGMHKASLL